MQLAVAEKMIEAQSADAEAMPFAKHGRRDIRICDSDAAQPVGSPRQRIEHRGIIVAVRTALHQHAARKADGIEHAEVFFQRRIRRRVAAVVGIGESIRWPEYMRMGIAGIGRRRHLRTGYVARRQAGGNHPAHSALIPAALMIGPHLS